MKISVSLAEDDVAFLDAYADDHGVPSRSAAVQRAVQVLRASTLGADYAAAFDEWTDGHHDRTWDTTASDGLTEGE